MQRDFDPRKWTQVAVYFFMFNVAVLSTATFFIIAFACSPPSLFWDPQGQAEGLLSFMAQDRQQVFFNANGILKFACPCYQSLGLHQLTT